MLLDKIRKLFLIVIIFLLFAHNVVVTAAGFAIDFEELSKELRNTMIEGSREFGKTILATSVGLGGVLFMYQGAKRVIDGNDINQIFFGSKYSYRTTVINQPTTANPSVKNAWAERFKGLVQMAAGIAAFHFAWKNLNQQI